MQKELREKEQQCHNLDEEMDDIVKHYKQQELGYLERIQEEENKVGLIFLQCLLC